MLSESPMWVAALSGFKKRNISPPVGCQPSLHTPLPLVAFASFPRMLPLALCHQHLLSSQYLSPLPQNVLNSPSESDSKLVSFCSASRYFLASLLLQISATPSKDHPEKQFPLHHMCIPQATSVRPRTIPAKTVLTNVPRGFYIVRFRRYFNASSSLCPFLITQIL